MIARLSSYFRRRANHLRHRFQRERQAIYIGDNQLLLRTRDGVKMAVDSRDVSLTPCLALDGCWEPDITEALRGVIKPGMHVIEVGANFGYFTLQMARWVGAGGQIHAFEANPAVFKFLRKNVMMNGLGEICKVYNLAGWHEEGNIELTVVDEFLGGSSVVIGDKLRKWGDRVSTTHRVSVPCVVLDRFAELPERIDFIKIDAEGAEPFILDGMREIIAKNPQAVLCLEFCERFFTVTQRDAREFLRGLRGQGFSIAKISSKGEPRTSTDEEILAAGHCELLLRR